MSPETSRAKIMTWVFQNFCKPSWANSVKLALQWLGQSIYNIDRLFLGAFSSWTDRPQEQDWNSCCRWLMKISEDNPRKGRQENAQKLLIVVRLSEIVQKLLLSNAKECCFGNQHGISNTTMTPILHCNILRKIINYSRQQYPDVFKKEWQIYTLFSFHKVLVAAP